MVYHHRFVSIFLAEKNFRILRVEKLKLKNNQKCYTERGFTGIVSLSRLPQLHLADKKQFENIRFNAKKLRTNNSRRSFVTK